MGAPRLALYPGAASEVSIGGQPVVAVYGGVQGGLIFNPQFAADQGIAAAETLFVDLINPATPYESPTTYPIQPGQTWNVPAGQANNVTVNAATSGHRFSVVIFQTPTPFPPTPIPGQLPTAPTGLTKMIPSYLYEEYKDDDDLQAFVAAYNTMAQQYLDWFNSVQLPIYTGLSGDLLDWIAEGVYGITRPSLGSGQNRDIGPFNTWAFNTIPFNKRKIIGPSNVTVTSDDIFKRIITWHFFKGDGKVFNVRWLKRRIMRFLTGTNGIDPGVNETYQVSVTFGTNGQVTITIVQGFRTLTGGALFNRFGFNQNVPFNSIRSTFTSITPLPNAAILQEAIESGVLELPFQFTWNVVVGV